MKKAKKLQAKIIKREKGFDGFFKVDELTIEMDRHDGTKQTVHRDNFERGHAVGVLAYDPKTDQVLMINEMRPGMLAAGLYPFNDSIIAGMIDKGETQLQAASREGEEETGQHLKNMKLIHPGAYVSAGGTSEKLALAYGTFDATKAGGIHGEAAEGEDIKSMAVSADEFIARAKDGRLKDMKSLVMAFWLANHRDEMRDPDFKPPAAPAEKPAPIATKPPQAVITHRETLFEDQFKIEQLTIEMDKHDGGKQVLKRLNYERGDSVAMLGYDPLRDEVVMVNEMRSGPLAAGDDPYTDSVPAAMLGKGDDAIVAAVKQMRRKTGLELGEAVVIHPGAFLTAGGSSEKTAMVAGIIDTKGANGKIHGRSGTEDSFKNVVLKSDEFIARAERGELKDMKSMAFAFWLALNKKSLQQKAAAKPKVTKKKTSRKNPGVK